MKKRTGETVAAVGLSQDPLIFGEVYGQVETARRNKKARLITGLRPLALTL